jgi:hypothetical protein
MDMTINSNYVRDDDGLLRPSVPIANRESEYNETAFEMLAEMQDRHFWYRGRHLFLLNGIDRHLKVNRGELTAIDLGGGLGEWIRDLVETRSKLFATLALADSSLVALNGAKSILPSTIERCQIDLMDLQMDDCWDVAFL